MKIRIYRNKELVNFAGVYNIFVNGINVEKIKFGENYKDIEVDQETAKIQIKIQWCGSNVIETQSNKNSNELVVSSKINFFKTTLIVFFMVLFGFLGYTIDFKFMYLMFLVYAYPFYYITFGKNKYLNLSNK